MVERLIKMYDRGSITGYQVMIDCLHMLDPANPELVLSDLPSEILDEFISYAERYDSTLPASKRFAPPAEDQVRAAEQWIHAHRVMSSKPVNR